MNNRHTEKPLSGHKIEKHYTKLASRKEVLGIRNLVRTHKEVFLSRRFGPGSARFKRDLHWDPWRGLYAKRETEVRKALHFSP
jgi:hypothetical protein